MDAPTNSGLAERLERGDLVTFSPCPFALPKGEERSFLYGQRLLRAKKNISFNPENNSLTGSRLETPEQTRRLAHLLGAFSQEASAWLARLLPHYAACWRLDRASFRPEEEATRKLRLTARNDLLHLDAFPSRPTQGYRILRLYVNIHPAEPRVWVTSSTFAKLLADYGPRVGLPNLESEGWAWRFGQGLLGLFQPGSRERTVYDRFMLRFHHFLKSSHHFQEHGPRKFWHFAPSTAWLAFTDGLSHAELRGRYALEHSYLVAPQSLLLPDESPAALLERACGVPVLPRAA